VKKYLKLLRGKHRRPVIPGPMLLIATACGVAQGPSKPWVVLWVVAVSPVGLGVSGSSRFAGENCRKVVLPCKSGGNHIACFDTVGLLEETKILSVRMHALCPGFSTGSENKVLWVGSGRN
jgi:hypothetical protein